MKFDNPINAFKFNIYTGQIFFVPICSACCNIVNDMADAHLCCFHLMANKLFFLKCLHRKPHNVIPNRLKWMTFFRWTLN